MKKKLTIALSALILAVLPNWAFAADEGCTSFELPYDGDIHSIDVATDGKPMTVSNAERNIAPITVFSPEVGDGFFEKFGLTVHPGFAGTIDFDFVNRYLVHLPLIPHTSATFCVAVGIPPVPDPAPGTLKKGVSTDIYSGNGKKKSFKVTVAADSDCPVDVESDGEAGLITVQPGFSGTVEESNAKCEPILIKASCEGEGEGSCSFTTS